MVFLVLSCWLILLDTSKFYSLYFYFINISQYGLECKRVFIKDRLSDPCFGFCTMITVEKEQVLFSVYEINQDFTDFDILTLTGTEIALNKGLYHLGMGRVIRFIGNKK